LLDQDLLDVNVGLVVLGLDGRVVGVAAAIAGSAWATAGAPNAWADSMPTGG
jgi:hypothetical protein